MALGETPDSTKIILEQKDLSDLTPEEKRREAQQFIINMHTFMMDRIRELEDFPQEKFDFVASMGELEESFIQKHAGINPVTPEVWNESRNREPSPDLSERLEQARNRASAYGERLQAEPRGEPNRVKLTVIEGGKGEQDK